jgi:hypothetical protein
MPFTIATLVVALSVLVAYKVSNLTSFQAMTVALLSLLETLSWIVVAIFAGIATLSTDGKFVKTGFWLIVCALIIHVVNNLVWLYFAGKYFRPDY